MRGAAPGAAQRSAGRGADYPFRATGSGEPLRCRGRELARRDHRSAGASGTALRLLVPDERAVQRLGCGRGDAGALCDAVRGRRLAHDPRSARTRRLTMSEVSEAEAANELMRLAKTIARHDRLYHAEDAPEISDAEYDALVRRNAELEAAFPHLVRADSPSRKVGHEVAAAPVAKVQHAVRMASLDKAFADEEVAEFVARVRRYLNLPEGEPVAFTGEDKIDGLSCALRYENGALVLAATRGDGQVGE